jgi:lysine 2,3-aminomutase
MDPARYSRDGFLAEASALMALIRQHADVRSARNVLFDWVTNHQFDVSLESRLLAHRDAMLVRDCARAWRGILRKSTDQRVGFSVIAALWDIAHDNPRPELQPGFYAEMIHLYHGIEGHASLSNPFQDAVDVTMHGREAAEQRSLVLDGMWGRVSAILARYPDGLSEEARARRAARRERILRHFAASPDDWQD